MLVKCGVFCSSLGSGSLRVRCDFDVSAGGGIRTHEPLKDRVLSFALILDETCAVGQAWQPPHSKWQYNHEFIYCCHASRNFLIECFMQAGVKSSSAFHSGCLSQCFCCNPMISTSLLCLQHQGYPCLCLLIPC